MECERESDVCYTRNIHLPGGLYGIEKQCAMAEALQAELGDGERPLEVRECDGKVEK